MTSLQVWAFELERFLEASSVSSNPGINFIWYEPSAYLSTLYGICKQFYSIHLLFHCITNTAQVIYFEYSALNYSCAYASSQGCVNLYTEKRADIAMQWSRVQQRNQWTEILPLFAHMRFNKLHQLFHLLLFWGKSSCFIIYVIVPWYMGFLHNFMWTCCLCPTLKWRAAKGIRWVTFMNWLLENKYSHSWWWDRKLRKNTNFSISVYTSHFRGLLVQMKTIICSCEF